MKLMLWGNPRLALGDFPVSVNECVFYNMKHEYMGLRGRDCTGWDMPWHTTGDFLVSVTECF